MEKKDKLYNIDDKKRYSQSLPKVIDEAYRDEYRKDHARIIHSPAFRRLQGKTQLFPNHESDFQRNRLTHSLEVAQIAKSIASKINYEFMQHDPINLDIVEIAGLAHDLGHPPFGHNGEEALDELMRDNHGGFEGNAQTLRILSRLEKKVTCTVKSHTNEFIPVTKAKKDNRSGLNLTARVLASVLKYDNVIKTHNEDRGKYTNKVTKGYYETDKELVEFIKKSVLGSKTKVKKFKTVECQIMDIADDIAYSTYDFEDALKAGFFNPLNLFSYSTDFYKEIAKEVKSKLNNEYAHLKSKYKKEDFEFSDIDLMMTLNSIFGGIYEMEPADGELVSFPEIGNAAKNAKKLASDGYYRTDFTSQLVSTHIEGIRFQYDEENPSQSLVYLDPDVFKIVETMKKFAYKTLIMSPMLKVAEFRGKEIVHEIFNALWGKDTKRNNGYLLLPDDYKTLYLSFDGNIEGQKRVVCDFIAGMTDRYALEFYNRLYGTNPETVHKPM